MGSPDVDVTTKALRNEARMWERQGETLKGIHYKVEELRIANLEAGIFQDIFDAYTRAINHISKVTMEGFECMGDISDALIKNARAYDDGEDEVTQTVKGAY